MSQLLARPREGGCTQKFHELSNELVAAWRHKPQHVFRLVPNDETQGARQCKMNSCPVIKTVGSDCTGFGHWQVWSRLAGAEAAPPTPQGRPVSAREIDCMLAGCSLS